MISLSPQQDFEPPGSTISTWRRAANHPTTTTGSMYRKSGTLLSIRHLFQCRRVHGPKRLRQLLRRTLCERGAFRTGRTLLDSVAQGDGRDRAIHQPEDFFSPIYGRSILPTSCSTSIMRRLSPRFIRFLRLDGFLAGRYGAWIYNSMEDSLLAGKEAATK